MLDLDEALKRLRSRPPHDAAGTPSPHILVEPRKPLHEPIPAHPPTTHWNWPETVLHLEQTYRQRFEKLARHIEQSALQDHKRIILFTSCFRAEGRTTLLLTLARILKDLTLRTALVDADLVGPSLARQLGFVPQHGLEDHLAGAVGLDSILLKEPGGTLALCPLRSAVSRPRSLLASPAWTCLMARLRLDFDLVLIDGGPLFAGLNAVLMNRSVDAAVLVHHQGITAERSITRACEVLESAAIPVLGLAHTFTSDPLPASVAERSPHVPRNLRFDPRTLRAIPRR